MPSNPRIASSTTTRKVRFPKSTSTMASPSTATRSSVDMQSPTSILEQLLQNQATRAPRSRRHTLSGNEDEGTETRDEFPRKATIFDDRLLTPSIYLSPPLLGDDVATATSEKQEQTMKNIMKHLDQTPLPTLDKLSHAAYLQKPLDDPLSGHFAAYDASRPWLLYWCLNGLAMMRQDVGIYHQQLIATAKTMQSPLGGFGGGHGQYPHLAATYAMLLSLTITTHYISKNIPEIDHPALYSAAFSWINRKQLLTWLRQLKLPNGGFKVNEDGEEDVRAGYCALIVCALMCYDAIELQGDIAKGDTPLLDGVAEYFTKCQTWEGGIAAKQHSEAHGGYAFCVLGALCLLGNPKEMLTKYLNIDALMSWLSARQYAPEGGLSGRTNKLVDGCYSTWVGGCWSLVEAAVNGNLDNNGKVGSLWSRKGMIRYIMCCCQDDKGGLKDKPGMRPDQYHTNYVLLGLSSAQHYFYYQDPDVPLETGDQENIPFQAAFSWKASKNVPACSTADGMGGGWEEGLVEDLGDRLEMHHPVFNVPLGAEQGVWRWWKWWRENGKFEGTLVMNESIDITDT